jgi:hypothetical protein
MKRSRRFFYRQPLNLAGSVETLAQVVFDKMKVTIACRGNCLYRSAIDRAESCAQDFVASNQAV